MRGRASQVVIDKETGTEMVLDNSDNTLFFIPFHFWGPILMVIGAALCAVEFA